MPCTPGCGSCCDLLTVSQRVAELIWGPVDPEVLPARDGEWIADNWEPLREASGGQVRLRCVSYDIEARACTTYDVRPDVCRRFPFYGDDPQTRFVENICGYQAELGRTVLPLTVL